MRYHGARSGGGARAARRARSRSWARRRRRWRAPTTSRAGGSAAAAAGARHAAAAARRSTSSTCARTPARPGRRCCRRRWPRRWAAALAAGEQSILFLNRRGFSTLRAVPRVRARRSLSALLGVDDLSPRARPPGLPLLRPHRSAVPERCPRAGAARSSGWAWAPSRSRRSCASASPTRASRGWIATPPATAAAGSGLEAILGAHARRRDRRAGRDADGDQGARLPGRHAGRRAAARSGDEPAGLPRRGADVPAARAGGGARGARRAARAASSSRPTSPSIRRSTRAAAHDYEGFVARRAGGPRGDAAIRRSRA